MSNDAWATTTCTPLIGNISNYDFEDSASPRNGALLAGMQKLVGRQLDGSGVEVAGAQEDMADYTAEIQNLVTPGFFFAGIIVVALLPLWVSRCCAHKCCKHKKTTYGGKHKAAAGGCCGLWGIVTVVCAIAGIASATTFGTGVQKELCVVSATLDTAETAIRATDTAAGSLQVSLSSFSSTLVPLTTSAKQISAAFDSDGKVTNACTSLQSAITTTDELKQSIKDICPSSGDGCDISDSNSLSYSPEWPPMVAALQAAKVQTCTTLPAELKSVAAEAVTATETASQTTADLDTSFGSFMKLLADGVKQTDDTGNDVKKLMKENWDNITNFAPLIGIALFALTLFLFVVALVGGGCMAVCARKQSASKAARCCHGFGVFASGGAWVGTSLCGVALLVIGSFILLFAALIFDFGSLMGSLPDPVTTLVGADRCLLYSNAPFKDTNIPSGSSGMTFGFDNDNDGVAESSLALCAVVKGCMGNSTSLVPYIENSFNVDLSVTSLNVTINSKLYDSGVFDIDTANIGAATSEGDSASTKLATMATPAGVEGLCNCNCVDPNATSCTLYTSVGQNLTSIKTDLDSAISGIASTTSILDTLLLQMNQVRLAIPALLTAVGGINGALSCAWLKPVFLAPFKPLAGDVSMGLTGLALSLLCCGGLGVFFIASLIHAQIKCGNVGIEPGCPKFCRCCCPGAGKAIAVAKDPHGELDSP